MKTVLRGVAAAALLALLAPVAGAQTGYATDSNTDLYTVDFATATASLIGNTGVFFEAVALSPAGALFGTDSSGQLFSLDTTTGAATLIGATGLGNIEGLDFNGNTLLGTNFSNPTTFYTIDTSTAVATPGATTSPAQGLARAMALESPTTALLLTDSPAFQTLQAVDLTTGAATARGFVGSPDGIYGIDFSGSTLYGLGGDGGVFTINAATGAASLIGDTGGQFWLSLAIAPSVTAPVPEPGSAALLGGMVTLGGLAARRRARR